MPDSAPQEQKQLARLWGLHTLLGFVAASICIALFTTAALNSLRASLLRDIERQLVYLELLGEHQNEAHLQHGVNGLVKEFEARRDTLAHYGRTGETFIGQRQGDRLVFLTNRRFNPTIESGVNIKEVSWLPMAHAAQGETGTMLTLDYRKHPVVAAYTYSKKFDIGIVNKMDLAEARSPLFAAVLLTILISLAVGVTELIVFNRATLPLVRRGQEREILLSSLIEILPLAVMVQDQQGNTILSNGLCRELVAAGVYDYCASLEQERKHAEVEGSSPSDLLRAGASSSYSGSVHVGEFLREFIFSRQPVLDQKGRVNLVISTAADVTAERRAAAAQSELASREVEIETLRVASATYSHELASPLTAVLCDLHLLLEHASEPRADAQEILEEAYGAAQRMRETLDKLNKLNEVRLRDYVGTSRIIDLREEPDAEEA